MVGVICTLSLFVVCVILIKRKHVCGGAKSADDSDNELTPEEEALIAKKLGASSYKPNNLDNQRINNYSYNQPKILNSQQNYHKTTNTRQDTIIKRNYGSNQHIKIHNNLHKTGTEI